MSAHQRVEDEIARLQRELAAAKAVGADEKQRMTALSKVQQENALLEAKRGTSPDVSEESSQDTSAAAPAVHDALPPPESSVPGWFAFPALRCPRRMPSLERAAFGSRQVLVPLGKRHQRACSA